MNASWFLCVAKSLVCIKQSRGGKFAGMCQGMRDMFLHGAMLAGLRVRAAEAYNYAPQFTELITYGHSTAKVFVKGVK